MPKDAYLGVDGDQLGLRLELELPHSDKVLVDLGEALLASVLQVLREELEFFRHSLQGLGVVARQLVAGLGWESCVDPVDNTSSRDDGVAAIAAEADEGQRQILRATQGTMRQTSDGDSQEKGRRSRPRARHNTPAN